MVCAVEYLHEQETHTHIHHTPCIQPNDADSARCVLSASRNENKKRDEGVWKESSCYVVVSDYVTAVVVVTRCDV